MTLLSITLTGGFTPQPCPESASPPSCAPPCSAPAAAARQPGTRPALPAATPRQRASWPCQLPPERSWLPASPAQADNTSARSCVHAFHRLTCTLPCLISMSLRLLGFLERAFGFLPCLHTHGTTQQGLVLLPLSFLFALSCLMSMLLCLHGFVEGLSACFPALPAQQKQAAQLHYFQTATIQRLLCMLQARVALISRDVCRFASLMWPSAACLTCTKFEQLSRFPNTGSLQLLFCMLQAGKAHRGLRGV